ncbi:hypothetical protein FQZ97_675370 [compost metagenome]
MHFDVCGLEIVDDIVASHSWQALESEQLADGQSLPGLEQFANELNVEKLDDELSLS